MAVMDGWLEARITVATAIPIDCNDGSGGGPFVVTIPVGKYTFAADDSTGVTSPFIPGIVAEFNRLSTAAGCSVQMAIGATGLVTVSAGVGTPTITWDAASADFETIIGFSTNVTTQNQVGTQLPAALWVPDCSLTALHGAANTIDDWRGEPTRMGASTESRLGDFRALVYQTRYTRAFEWPAVSNTLTWIHDETLVNASFERWYKDVILQEASWASGVFCWNYDRNTGHAGNLLYRVVNPPEMVAFEEHWTGRFSIKLPRCLLLPAFNEQGVWQ